MFESVVILAISEDFKVLLMVVQLIATIVLASITGLLANKARKIETLETDLKQTASKLVAAEIATQTVSLQTSLNSLTTQMQDVNRRLEQGDGSIDQLVGADHKQEVRTVSVVSDLKEWVRDHAAGKDQVKDLSDRVERLHQLIVESLATRIEQAAAKVEQAATVRAGKGA